MSATLSPAVIGDCLATNWQRAGILLALPGEA
jgi:hypothetical protein